MTRFSDYIEPTEYGLSQGTCFTSYVLCEVCLELAEKDLAKDERSEEKGSAHTTHSSACAEAALSEQAEKRLYKSQGEDTWPSLWDNRKEEVFLGT